MVGGSWFVLLTSLALALTAVGIVTLVAWVILVPRSVWRLWHNDVRYLRDLRWVAVAGAANVVGYVWLVSHQALRSGASSWHEYLFTYGQWGGDVAGILFVCSGILVIGGVVLAIAGPYFQRKTVGAGERTSS